MTEKLEKLTPEDGKSLDVEAQNIEQLKQLFPDVFREGKVDFEALKAVLGEHIEDKEERYNFTWHGKNKARQIAQTPSTGTLRPCKEESVNWDITQNLFIEGDNLEVLKLLQKSYHQKVKMIYIDPPYNTGNDFVYNDDFSDNITNYLNQTNQVDLEGLKHSKNSDSSGRFHTNWLNMMYPRLKLARNLLSKDGLLFISIDNNEITNLVNISNEIFGEENILSIVSNVNNPKGRSDDKFIATAHEYLLVVAKDSNSATVHGFKPEENILKRYNKLDEHGKKYREIDLRKTGDSDKREDRPDMFYYFYFDKENNQLKVSKEQMIGRNFIEICPKKDDGTDGRWRWGFETASKRLNDVFPKFMPTKKIWGIMEKDYLEGRPPVKATSAWTHKDVNSERGSEQFIELGFHKEVFSRPKPIGTLLRTLQIGTIPDETSIVMDFFAGSGTFAEAVFKANSEHNRKLKFIAIQLPEFIDSTKKENVEALKFCKKIGKPAVISEITKERIVRAGKSVQSQNLEDSFDVGFKVFKLDETNINQWDSNFDNLTDILHNSVDSLKPERSHEDVLYEILLKYGLDLTYPITEHILSGKTVYDVAFGSLIVCLDDGITREVVEGIGKLKQKLGSETTRVVFKDAGFADDAVKVNAVQLLKQYSVDDVKSI